MTETGKTVVITGASGAIGSAVAKRFAAEGHSLVLNSHTRPERCEEQVDELRTAGATVYHHNGDVSSQDGAAGLMRAAVREFGTVDVLLNIAGATVGGGPADDLGATDWEAAFAANFYSAVYCSQAALKVMSGSRGWIVNTSSVRGLWASGRPAIMAYSMAKAALVNYTSTLAKTTGPDILVNAVAPGFVWTPNYASMPVDLRNSFVEATTLKRFITAGELADSYVFLASTTCITGQTIVVDGGFSLIMS
ncbi:SDR family NAD(P)-dependent oxidoreductase [Actinoallomurus sp. CA-150999]|uniref:SDR family NAD(P)-dependent oxidoreductase n=1 Tax=Actinoallomurus sp. CA-150999 TaxID=3239887 RepID=UPI003D8B4BCA